MDPTIDFLFRWGHFLAGVTWIGLLYYFNFVQGAYFKEADDSARVDAFTKLVPRALWWFRWGAMFTFITGCLLLGNRAGGGFGGYTQDIALGALMGTLMFINVWGIIWRNQKIVIASNEQIKAGGEALASAAGAAGKALLASRTNTLFSLPMLFFMGSSAHLPSGVTGGAGTGFWIALLIIIVLEVNAIVGKQGPITTVSGVITSGFVLTAVLWGLLKFL